MCQLLLKKGAALSEVDNEGMTVLHWAVISREVDSQRYLYHISSYTVYPVLIEVMCYFRGLSVTILIIGFVC